jgi:hypothetical protein
MLRREALGALSTNERSNVSCLLSPAYAAGTTFADQTRPPHSVGLVLDPTCEAQSKDGCRRISRALSGQDPGLS